NTTKSARQIAADFIVRTRERRDGVANKAYQPEHDPEKWVPVFGKDHAPPKASVPIPKFASLRGTFVCDRTSRGGTTSPSPCRFFDGCARPPVTAPLATSLGTSLGTSPQLVACTSTFRAGGEADVPRELSI